MRLCAHALNLSGLPLSHFPSDDGNKREEREDYSKEARYGQSYRDLHRPLSRDERIIALADHLSAGERADPTEDTRAAHPGQLLSIFCAVEAEGKQAPNPQFVPLQPLRLVQEALFPGPTLSPDQIWKRYEDMWADFTQEAGQLRQAHATNGDLPTYLETLLLLIQRMTWCLPSAYYRARPDISLYDHSRMTAARAAVLMDSALDDERLERLGQAPQDSRRR